MAKRNKSAAIRKIVADKPDASVKEIQAALAAKRMKVSVALIHQVKGRRQPAKHPASNGHVSMDGLLAAKAMVAKLGSVDAAREALNQFAKLIET